MKKNLIFVLIFTFFLILIFINKEIVQINAVNSLILWQNKIFPSLFIMFVFQDLLISYNAAEFLNILLNNLFSKIFGLSTNGQMAFVLSLFSGSPSNAFILNELTENNKLSKKEANHILKFSYFANPLFLYTMLSLIFNDNTPQKIIITLYISNILLGISLKRETFFSEKNLKINENNFGNVLTNAIKKSTNTLIMILGSVTFFMIISSLISSFFNNDLILSMISGFFEITAGLNTLINLNITNNIKEIIATVIISFGGISIHSQVYSIIKSSNLSYLSFLKGRLYATIIAVLIIIII